MQSAFDRDLRQRIGQEKHELCFHICNPQKQANGYVKAIHRLA